MGRIVQLDRPVKVRDTKRLFAIRSHTSPDLWRTHIGNVLLLHLYLHIEHFKLPNSKEA